MFNNFLNSFNQRPYEKYKTHLEKIMAERVAGRANKICHPFHIDCSITG